MSDDSKYVAPDIVVDDATLTYGQRHAIVDAMVALRCLELFLRNKNESGYMSRADARFDVQEQLGQLERNFPTIAAHDPAEEWPDQL